MHVAIYARVSTTRQADNDLSIPDQLRQLKEWATANGHLVVHEYIEPGASATDDKRPVFQQMIHDALQKPQMVEAIIIHSLSRFFRDGIQFGVYERKLLKNKVKVISITQPTSDDAGGEMMRRIINLFDEHQSKENSKHTSRAMKENARQGYFNGSRPPFGYIAVATETTGSHGRKKKKLAINEAEAGIVKMIYDLYLHGDKGRSLGCKEIAKLLTDRGLLMRGGAWGIQKVHKLLSDSLYMGDYYFNVINSQTGERRSPSEWVKTSIPVIVDPAVFEQVRRKRELRAPAQTPPRITSSPTLLTGLLKCGECGGALTLVTGKSGKYKYYKCTSRQNKGNHACTSGNIPMEKLDQLVLSQLADRVFAKDRLNAMMVALRKRIKESATTQQTRVNELSKQLKQVEERRNRLMDAIESGILDLDETVQRRAQHLKASREALLVEMAVARREVSLPVDQIKTSQVELFGQSLRQRLMSNDKGFAKSYLNLLVNEITIKGKEATIKGSYSALAYAASIDNKKVGHLLQVPTSLSDWCARRDSNS
ncbi:recombinase family protein [Methylobacillus glycogenes]|uniref:recombinase family protein n=1 Tax=Methylobacillus glycogenes TaxID=406 RepID=UPI00046F5BFD|nr:recombinase family protein [Methylobacillus glycogenes]